VFVESLHSSVPVTAGACSSFSHPHVFFFGFSRLRAKMILLPFGHRPFAPEASFLL